MSILEKKLDNKGEGTMKKVVIFSILIAIGAILLTSCQTNQNDRIEIKMKSQEEQMKIQSEYTYDDYKKAFDSILVEAEHFKTEDILLKKWIIRTLVAEKLYYETDLTDEQVLKLSKQTMEENIAWKELAEEKYGVTVSKRELDAYVKDLPEVKNSLQFQAYAEALGLTLKELNNYDRDLYEKNLVWQKLIPKLEEQYNTKDNNVLIQKYKEEVENSL